MIAIYCTYEVKRPSLMSASYLGGRQVGSFIFSEPCVLAWTGGHNVFVFCKRKQPLGDPCLRVLRAEKERR